MPNRWHKRALYAGLGLAAAAIALGFLLWMSPRGVTSAELSQNEIEASALTQAKAGIAGLQLDQTGKITAVRRMTLGQAVAVLGSGRSPAPDWSNTVWVVVFQGRTVFTGGPPGKDGTYTPLVSSDMYVVLDTTGEPISYGSRGPNMSPLNLDALPPVAAPSGPTATPNKQTPGPTSTPAPRN